MKLSRQSIVNKLMKLKDSNSTRIFTVAHRYRDNAQNRKLGRVGKVRTTNCAFNVGAYEVGGLPAYDPKEKRLFWVCDMGIINANKDKPREERPNPYRSIGWDEIVNVRMDGQFFEPIEETNP